MTAIYLDSFRHLRPVAILGQDQIKQWLIELHTKASPESCAKTLQRTFEKFSVSEDKISSRASFHPNIGRTIKDKTEIDDHDLGKRAAIAQENALNIFSKFYPKDFSEVARDLLHVSCTHYHSPSAAQITMAQNGHTQTRVTHLYHMGCYAALPAIRVAQGLTLQSGQTADIVHTEFCSFHFDPLVHTPEQVIVQTLFADGAIKYRAHAEKPQEKSFKLLALKEELVPDSSNDMTWTLGSSHFNMTLSRHVPRILSQRIEQFFDALFDQAKISPKNAFEDVEFAIHPGGPKIIEKVADIMNLSAEQIELSQSILFQYGNMSSATLPHIWEKILNTSSKKYVASVAFGPGLTMTGAMFQICR